MEAEGRRYGANAPVQEDVDLIKMAFGDGLGLF